jgi:hypothetical protein
MRMAWGIVAVVLIAGCSSKKQDKSPIVREEEMPPPTQPVIPEAPADNNDDPAAVPPDPPSPDAPKPECVDESTVVSWDPGKLRACFDSNGDEQADRCVTWRRDGKVAAIDTEFAVEDADAKDEPEAPIEYRTDIENNEDERISNDGASIEICPYDRACMRIMPKLPNGEIQSVVTDPEYKRAVFVIKDFGTEHGIYEIWDLAAGRMRTRSLMKRLVTDETYDFSARMGSGVVIAIATDSNSRALGTIFSADGAFRGELAQGSRNLDLDKTFTSAGVFGIVDVGAIDSDDEKPYVLYLHSLSSGGSIGKFSIKRDADGDDDLSLTTLKHGFVAVTQWGEQVRIDMIDLRTRTNRVLLAPGC